MTVVTFDMHPPCVGVMTTARLCTRAVAEEGRNYRGLVRPSSLNCSPFGIMQQVLELGALCFQALHLLRKHALHLLQRLHASVGLRNAMTFCMLLVCTLTSDNASSCTLLVCDICNCISLACRLMAYNCCKWHFACMQYLHGNIAGRFIETLQKLQAVLCTLCIYCVYNT